MARLNLVEAARIELASKTVAPSITTSVSPVLFLGGRLSRGRLTDRPSLAGLTHATSDGSNARDSDFYSTRDLPYRPGQGGCAGL